jgi:hypothetical protein
MYGVQVYIDWAARGSSEVNDELLIVVLCRVVSLFDCGFLVEKFLRNLSAIFRELYEDLFVQPDFHFCGNALVAGVMQLR